MIVGIVAVTVITIIIVVVVVILIQRDGSVKRRFSALPLAFLQLSLSLQHATGAGIVIRVTATALKNALFPALPSR